MPKNAESKKGTVRIGIIGCGIAARDLLWPAFKRMPDRFQISAVCNRTKAKAKSFASMISEHSGHTVYHTCDYADVLDSSDIDAVAILTPIHLHFEMFAAAAQAGKHVLIEKPLAGDVASGRAMVRLAEEHTEQVFMVAENCRYRAVVQRLRSEIQAGSIGRPYHAELRDWQRIDESTNVYARTQWRREHKHIGGFLTDSGVHHVAILRCVLGDLRVTSSVAASVNPDIGQLDTMQFSFRTEGCDPSSPVTGNVSIAYSAFSPTDLRLSVFGTSGTAVMLASKLQIYAPSTSEPPVREIALPDDGGYYEELIDFHSAIAHGLVPRSSVAEGFQDLRIILGAIEMGTYVAS